MGTSTDVEALSLIDRVRFDLVILDLLEINGIDLLRRIKRQHGSIRVLVLGDDSDHQYADRMLAEGASGFVSRVTVHDQLMTKVREILGETKQIDRDTG